MDNVRRKINFKSMDGLTGEGIGIAVLDTGISPHNDLKKRIVCFKDFVNSRTEAYDDNGHGTHAAWRYAKFQNFQCINISCSLFSFFSPISI